MKKQHRLTRPRLAIAAFACIVIVLCLSAFTAHKKLIDDVWLQLGMNKEQSLNGVKNSFVNATYESKPAEWKQIFRAGKDVTDLTGKFAEQWLAELK